MLKRETKPTKKKQIERFWHLVDVEDEVLGRLATKIASLLIGKKKPYYTPHLDCGDYVVVVNAGKVAVTGRKEEGKIYYRHSGYPGGLKKATLAQLRCQKPKEIIRHAVAGMLPKNKLQAKMLVRLKIFVDSEHIYEDKFKK